MADVTDASRRPSRVAVALLHYPVYDRSRAVVTSSLTSVDLHDIARTARCYAVEPFYVVTPVAAQREMARRIAAHWLDEQEAPHPRAEALARVRVCESLDAALGDLAGACGATPFWAVTGASLDQDLTSFQDLRAAIHEPRHPAVLLVFGTGWGLSRDLTRAAPCRLEPIRGLDGFNHLPVRAAVAIVLDRLLGLRI